MVSIIPKQHKKKAMHRTLVPTIKGYEPKVFWVAAYW